MSDLSAAKSLPEEYGNLSVTLRKEKNAGETTDKFNSGTLEVGQGESNYSNKIQELESATLRLYLLTVDVTAYKEDVSYTYSTEYAREERYNVNFTYQGYPIVWDGSVWRYGNSSGTICDFAEETVIDYKYDMSQPTYCAYKETTYQEGEDADAGN